ncbi:MAG: hypothetical protein LC648_02780 [Novosphingobium sp.]|nr:hypothetical protein [Novosphingobium sp.]
MLTVFASLAFLAAACVAAWSVAATWLQYRDVALGNIAALGLAEDEREFRITISARGRKPALAGHPGVRRLPHRAARAGASLRRATRRAAA